MAPKNHSANSKTATILDRALYNERPDTRQELPFKSPKRERIERLVLADIGRSPSENTGFEPGGRGASPSGRASNQ